MADLTENDLHHLEEARKQLAAKAEKFFNYFGVRGDELEACHKEVEVFIKDFEQAGMGRGFFDSPLGRKAFIIGYFRGRAAGEWPNRKTLVSESFQKRINFDGVENPIPEWQR